MKLGHVMLVAVLLAAVPAAAQQEDPAEVKGSDELVKEKGRFAETWVHPDADLGRYDSVYAWDAVFDFRDGDEARRVASQSQMLSGRQGPARISEESRERFEEIVTEALLAELRRSKQFELVDEIGPRTLLIRGAFLDIVSNVPPRTAGTYDVHLADVGEATIVFELIDAETGVIQARVAERREIRPPSRMRGVNPAPATSATVWNDVRVWAASVARDLRVALDKAKKKAEKGS